MNDITMKLKVAADTAQAEAAAKKLKKEFHDAVNPTANAPRGAMKQASMPATSMQGVMDSRDSNMARGLGGLTGAEGRDFAKQAQGLGGLVHVYATFAANVFALSAAFSALSRAADVTNMTKGLDQLGAASGRALGSLSKQLVTVTDGAISMREAMTATAQASAGGMTNASILRMGEVAKQASQALGVAMPDALSRISRGITKLEPELLDEIGIMVRVDRTSQDYAASIGKTTAALTDFEKRQAFANAVLEQGEKKFGAIKLDANPYAKILASMENIAQTGLELVNKVLSPILTILSTSPTALATAMAGIAAILIKQAVPAIGSFKESLKASAENATKLSNLRSIEAKKANVAEIMNVRAQAEAVAEVRIAALDKEVAIREQVIAKSKFKEGSKIRDIFDKQATDVTDKDFAKIETQAKIAQTKGNLELADSYRIGAIRIKESAAAEAAYAAVVDKTTQSLAAKTKLTSTAGQFQKSVDRDNLASISRNITSMAAETAATNSFGKAWKDASESVKQAKLQNQFISVVDSLGNVTKVAVPAMGAIQGFWTMTKVGAVSAVSAIGTAISAFMPWLAVIGLVAGALSSVYSAFATSEKQAAKFSTALTGLSDAGENASKTLDSLSTKGFAEQIDPKSIQARANAFLEVSEAVGKTVKSFKDLAAARNGAENAMEWLYALVGFGDSDKLAKSMGTGVANSLKLLSDNPEAQKAAKNALQSLLGKDVDLEAPQSIIKALKKLDDGELVKVGTSLEGLFKKVNLDINNSASRLTSFVEGIASLSKTVTEANNRLNPTDDSFKLGAGLVAQSLSIAKVLEDGPIKSVAALLALVNDSKNLSLLPPGTTDNLIKNNQKLQDIQKTLGENLKLQQAAEAQLSKDKAARDKENPNNSASVDFFNPELVKNIAAQQKIVDDLRKESRGLEASANATVGKISEGISKDIFEAGGVKLAKSLEIAMESAAIVAGGAYLSVIKSIGGDTAAAESELRKIEISQQRSVIEATYASIQAIERNTLAQRETAALAVKAQLSSATGGSLDSRAEASVANGKELAAIDREKKIQSQALQDPRGVLKQLSSKDSTKEDRDAFAAQSTFVQGLIGYKVQMAAIDAKAYADTVQRMAGLESERVRNAQRAADSTIKAAQLEKSKLDIAKGIVGTYDEELASASLINDRAIAINENLKIREEIQGKINVASNLLASGKGSEEARKSAQSALDKAKIDRTENTAAGMQKQNELDAKALADKIAGEKALDKLSQDRLSTAAKTSSDIKLADIDASDRAIKYALDISSITAAEGLKKQEGLTLDKQSLDYTNQKLTLVTLLLDVEEKRKNLERISAAGQNTTEASAAFAAAAQNYTSQVALVDSRNASITQGIKLTSEHAQMQAKHNESLKEAQSLTEGLTSVFGDMGTNIGKVGEALTSAANSMELMAERREKLDKMTDGPDKIKAEIKYSKDKTNAELTGMANIAGASKKLFKEKSVGFRAFEAIEKGFHLWKLGANIAEAASTAFKDQSSIAGSIMRATVDAGAAVIKAISSMPFPLNIAAGAATALAVGSILGSIGGGGVSGPTGPSVEDQQAASGTGQSYNSNGQLENNGGGALGDASAKSTAIIEGIEKLATINYEMLQFSQNRTYDALVAIRDNTEGFVKAVGARLGGVGTNSAFGTVEGGYFNSNLISKIPLIGTTIAEPINKLTDALGLGSLFGEKVDRKVQDQGITVKGTLGALTSGGGIKQIYENIRDEWSSFLDSGVNEFTQTKKLDTKVDEYIVGIFKGFNAMLVSAAEALGTTGTKVESILNASDINLKVSSKGLTGAEYAEAIMSEIGIQLDIAANAAFPQLPALKTKFQEIGETNTDFIIRLISSSEQVGYALQSINKPIGDMAGLALTEASLNLEKLAGGLDSFVSLTNAFGDLFLTEAERLVPVTNAVGAELVRLGISTALTRDEFKQLVLSQDLTTESGREMYISLLKLAPAFDKVVPPIEQVTETVVKLLTAAELASAQTDQYITILGLLGNKEETLKLTRAKELAGMDERLRGTQTYIYKLQDLAKAQDAFNSSISSLSDTLFGLQNQLLTAQGAANGGAGALAAKAAIQQRTRTKDLAKMTAGLSATQTAAITTAYDYNTAISNQIEAQTAANTANTAATNANDALAAAQANAAQSAADSAKGIADAARGIKDAWQSLSDSLFEEVKRIRGLIAEGSTGAVAEAQAKFNKAAAAAKAGDSEAAKLLPGLSQSLLELTEQTATSSIDLKRAQAQTAGTIEDVGRTINSQYGLFGPEDTLARSQDAQNRAMESATASAASSAAAAANAVSAAQAVASAANATAASANAYLVAASTASGIAKKAAEDAYKIAKEKGETILTLEEWLASQEYAVENKAYADSILAKTAYFTTMLGLQTSFQTATVSGLQAAINTVLSTPIVVPAPTTATPPSTTRLPGDMGPPAPLSSSSGNMGATYYNRSGAPTIHQFDVGTDYVPKDMIAMLHEGEKITPKAYNTNQNQDLIKEIQALRQEVSMLRDVALATGTYTKKTSDTLTRVTLGGESMQTTVISSVPVPVA
jgi:hypothetical protein